MEGQRRTPIKLIEGEIEVGNIVAPRRDIRLGMDSKKILSLFILAAYL